MSLRYLEGTYDGTQQGATVMVDSVSGWAFGPLFESYDDAQSFVDSCDEDPRVYDDAELRARYAAWLRPRMGLTESF